MEEFKKRYLNITDNVYGNIVPLEKLNDVNIVQEIEDYLNSNFKNRFNIELLMFPNWATSNIKFKIGTDYYTHIRIKK